MNILTFLAIVLSVAMFCATALFSQYLDFIYKEKKNKIEDLDLKKWRF